MDNQQKSIGSGVSSMSSVPIGMKSV